MLLHPRKIIPLILATGLLVAFSLNCLGQELQTNAASPSKGKPETVEGLRKTIERLKADNDQLRARVSELEKRVDAQAIRDRLVQEEQRIENLLAQLVAIGEKEAPLQSRSAEIDEELRSENIDQLPISGSLRPEEVRESTRRRLTGEQNRLRSQIELLQQSRMRLQSSLSVTEMLVQNLRLRLQTLVRP
jgi:small-conductance mechanosensitive channel